MTATETISPEESLQKTHPWWRRLLRWVAWVGVALLIVMFVVEIAINTLVDKRALSQDVARQIYEQTGIRLYWESVWVHPTLFQGLELRLSQVDMDMIGRNEEWIPPDEVVWEKPPEQSDFSLKNLDFSLDYWSITQQNYAITHAQIRTTRGLVPDGGICVVEALEDIVPVANRDNCLTLSIKTHEGEEKPLPFINTTVKLKDVSVTLGEERYMGWMDPFVIAIPNFRIRGLLSNSALKWHGKIRLSRRASKEPLVKIATEGAMRSGRWEEWFVKEAEGDFLHLPGQGQVDITRWLKYGRVTVEEAHLGQFHYWLKEGILSHPRLFEPWLREAVRGQLTGELGRSSLEFHSFKTQKAPKNIAQLTQPNPYWGRVEGTLNTTSPIEWRHRSHPQAWVIPKTHGAFSAYVLRGGEWINQIEMVLKSGPLNLKGEGNLIAQENLVPKLDLTFKADPIDLEAYHGVPQYGPEGRLLTLLDGTVHLDSVHVYGTLIEPVIDHLRLILNDVSVDKGHQLLEHINGVVYWNKPLSPKGEIAFQDVRGRIQDQPFEVDAHYNPVSEATRGHLQIPTVDVARLWDALIRLDHHIEQQQLSNYFVDEIFAFHPSGSLSANVKWNGTLSQPNFDGRAHLNHIQLRQGGTLVLHNLDGQAYFRGNTVALNNALVSVTPQDRLTVDAQADVATETVEWNIHGNSLDFNRLRDFGLAMAEGLGLGVSPNHPARDLIFPKTAQLAWSGRVPWNDPLAQGNSTLEIQPVAMTMATIDDPIEIDRLVIALADGTVAIPDLKGHWGPITFHGETWFDAVEWTDYAMAVEVDQLTMASVRENLDFYRQIIGLSLPNIWNAEGYAKANIHVTPRVQEVAVTLKDIALSWENGILPIHELNGAFVMDAQQGFRITEPFAMSYGRAHLEVSDVDLLQTLEGRRFNVRTFGVVTPLEVNAMVLQQVPGFIEQTDLYLPFRLNVLGNWVNGNPLHPDSRLTFRAQTDFVYPRPLDPEGVPPVGANGENPTILESAQPQVAMAAVEAVEAPVRGNGSNTEATRSSQGNPAQDQSPGQKPGRMRGNGSGDTRRPSIRTLNQLFRDTASYFVIPEALDISQVGQPASEQSENSQSEGLEQAVDAPVKEEQPSFKGLPQGVTPLSDHQSAHVAPLHWTQRWWQTKSLQEKILTGILPQVNESEGVDAEDTQEVHRRRARGMGRRRFEKLSELVGESWKNEDKLDPHRQTYPYLSMDLAYQGAERLTINHLALVLPEAGALGVIGQIFDYLDPKKLRYDAHVLTPLPISIPVATRYIRDPDYWANAGVFEANVALKGRLAEDALPSEFPTVQSISSIEALNVSLTEDEASETGLGAEIKAEDELKVQPQAKVTAEKTLRVTSPETLHQLVGHVLVKGWEAENIGLQGMDFHLDLLGDHGTFIVEQLKLAQTDFQVRADIPSFSYTPIDLQNVEVKGKGFWVDAVQYFMTEMILNRIIVPVGQVVLIPMGMPQQASLPFQVHGGSVDLDEAIFNNIILTHLKSNLDIYPNAHMELSNLKFDMAGGDVKGKIALSPRYEGFVSLDLDINKVKANAMTRALLGVSNQVFGDMSGSIQITTSGHTEDEYHNNANGVVSITIEEGRLPTIAKVETLLAAANVVRGGLLGLNINNLIRSLQPFKTNYFAKLYGDFQMANGIAYVNPMVSDGENLDLFITGAVRMVDGKADLTVVGEMNQDVSSAFGVVGKLSLGRVVRVIPLVGWLPGNRNGLIQYIPGVGYIPGLGGPAQPKNKFQVQIQGLVDDPGAVRGLKWLN